MARSATGAVWDLQLSSAELQQLGALQLSSAELEQQQAAAALDICIQHHLAAEGIARLWCSSRSLQQLCSPLLSSAVLVRSVEAAAAAAAVIAGAAAPPAAEAHNSLAALQWLLRQPRITAATVSQCAQQLLAIPCVPLAAAQALVAAGLRMQITGQQLVQAAYSCVEGLEVWVAAFDSAGVPHQEWAADLPLGMLHMCCGRKVPQQVCVQLDQLHKQHTGYALQCAPAVQVQCKCSTVECVHKQYKCYAA
jgi:hypothetical protein